MTSTATTQSSTGRPSAVPRTTSTAGTMLLHGLAATAVAAVATSLLAVAGRAVGIDVAIAGAPIPASGFAVLTVAFSLVGLAIAAGLRRFAPRPRTAWLVTTVTLTVLSFVPDVLAPAGIATILLLMLTHVVAAAIVVPVVARRLP